MIGHTTKKAFRICLLIVLLASFMAGCADRSERESETGDAGKAPADIEATIPDTAGPLSSSIDKAKGSFRDNTPHVLIPTADGTVAYSNPAGTAFIDASNTSEGYIMADYTGSNPRVKLQLTGSNNITYSYDLNGDEYEVFPLTSGSGTYSVAIYEHIADGKYSLALSEEIAAEQMDEFAPYLYPNQYVNFDASAKTVALASELVAEAENDLDAVSDVYNYVIKNISYDHEKVTSVQGGYLPDVDDTLASGKGICFDYAAIMAAMLRSQRIPTRLEIGYAGKSYHAWISTYITDIGWVNGIIEFDGKNWTLMDPTFAASSSEKALKKFIGDGSNYAVEYVY